MFGLFEAMLIFLEILIVGICAWLAKSRGRNPIIWGILGFFFNVWAIAILLIIPKRKEGISAGKTGKSRNISYLGVLLLVATAVMTFGMVVSHGSPSLAELNLSPTLEVEPDHNWQGNATIKQLGLISDLRGTEVNTGELLERISPQTLQELPESLVEQLYEEPVQWLGTSLDDSLVCGSIEVVLKNKHGKGFVEAGVFYYYIGSRSKETLNGEPTLSGEFEDDTFIVLSNADIYRLSVYTGE